MTKRKPSLRAVYANHEAKGIRYLLVTDEELEWVAQRLVEGQANLGEESPEWEQKMAQSLIDRCRILQVLAYASEREEREKQKATRKKGTSDG